MRILALTLALAGSASSAEPLPAKLVEMGADNGRPTIDRSSPPAAATVTRRFQQTRVVINYRISA